MVCEVWAWSVRVGRHGLPVEVAVVHDQMVWYPALLLFLPIR